MLIGLVKFKVNDYLFKFKFHHNFSYLVKYLNNLLT